MLEKIRRIKASMVKESSSDALCSLCQVAPCDCAKGNHIAESAEQLDEANFAATMKKATAAHERGDHTKAKYHLDNAKTARYSMKSTEISKNKEHLDKYKELRSHYESVNMNSAEQLDELSSQALRSYKHKAELSIPKDDREYANRSKGIEKADKKLKKEELSGSQHKLDKNKNGKVDKHDFKLLRKEAAHPFDEFTTEQLEEFMQTEDYQQLDELSKSTLGSYVKKASNSAAMHAWGWGSQSKEHQGQTTSSLPSDYGKDRKQAQKRLKNISKATDRLTKEEAEQLDELSKKTLGSYIDKADDRLIDLRSHRDATRDDLRKHNAKKPAHNASYAERSAHSNTTSKLEKQRSAAEKDSTKAFSRLDKAKTKLAMTKEDTTELDEAMSPQQNMDFERMMKGAMSRNAYNAKWKKPMKSVSKVIYGKNVKEYGKNVKEAAQYPRAVHTDVKDVAAPRAPAEQDHAAMHKVAVKNGIPAKHEDGADKVKGAAKAQSAPKKNYIEDPHVNKDIYIQSFKSYVTMRGDLERM